jgi:hypothetical protein
MLLQDDAGFEGRTLHYRDALPKLQQALQELCALDPPISCLVTLGDCIDGHSGCPQSTQQDFHQVEGSFAAYAQQQSQQQQQEQDGSQTLAPVYHTLGNHCFSMPRDQLLAGLKLPSSYYSVSLGCGWRLIVLDTTEMSPYSGLPAVRGRKHCLKAMQYKIRGGGMVQLSTRSYLLLFYLNSWKTLTWVRGCLSKTAVWHPLHSSRPCRVIASTISLAAGRSTRLPTAFYECATARFPCCLLNKVTVALVLGPVPS